MTFRCRNNSWVAFIFNLKLYLPGNPDSTSQNALKFSNSKSSGTSKENVRSARVVTVILILISLLNWADIKRNDEILLLRTDEFAVSKSYTQRNFNFSTVNSVPKK